MWLTRSVGPDETNRNIPEVRWQLYAARRSGRPVCVASVPFEGRYSLWLGSSEPEAGPICHKRALGAGPGWTPLPEPWTGLKTMSNPSGEGVETAL